MKRKVHMSPIEREIYLRVIGSEPKAIPIAYCLHLFKKRRDLLKRLVDRGITGKFLVHFWHECHQSPIQMYKKLTTELYGDMASPLNIKDMA